MKPKSPSSKKVYKSAISVALTALLFLCANTQLLYASAPVLRMKLFSAPNAGDETVMYIQPGASVDFDGQYDAYKLFGPTSAAGIWQEYNSTPISINGVSLPQDSMQIDLRLKIPSAGTYTLSVFSEDNFNGFCNAVLEDKNTGSRTAIINSSVIVNLSASNNLNRFVLHVYNIAVSASAKLVLPSCSSNSAARINVKVSRNGTFRYIYKTGSQVLRDVTIPANRDSISFFVSGTFSVSVLNLNGGRFDTIINVINFSKPVASMVVPDTIIKNHNVNLVTINTSSNSNTYVWNFGDGTAASSQFQPTHAYNQAGSYFVKLKAYSARGCSDSIVKRLIVLSKAKGETVAMSGNGQNIYQYRNLQPSNDLKIQVVAASQGQSTTQRPQKISSTEAEFDLSALPGGIYYILLYDKDELLHRATVLVK